MKHRIIRAAFAVANSPVVPVLVVVAIIVFFRSSWS